MAKWSCLDWHYGTRIQLSLSPCCNSRSLSSAIANPSARLLTLYWLKFSSMFLVFWVVYLDPPFVSSCMWFLLVHSHSLYSLMISAGIHLRSVYFCLFLCSICLFTCYWFFVVILLVTVACSWFSCLSLLNVRHFTFAAKVIFLLKWSNYFLLNTNIIFSSLIRNKPQSYGQWFVSTTNFSSSWVWIKESIRET